MSDNWSLKFKNHFISVTSDSVNHFKHKIKCSRRRVSNATSAARLHVVARPAADTNLGRRHRAEFLRELVPSYAVCNFPQLLHKHARCLCHDDPFLCSSIIVARKLVIKTRTESWILPTRYATGSSDDLLQRCFLLSLRSRESDHSRRASSVIPLWLPSQPNILRWLLLWRNWNLVMHRDFFFTFTDQFTSSIHHPRAFRDIGGPQPCFLKVMLQCKNWRNTVHQHDRKFHANQDSKAFRACRLREALLRYLYRAAHTPATKILHQATLLCICTERWRPVAALILTTHHHLEGS